MLKRVAAVAAITLFPHVGEAQTLQNSATVSYPDALAPALGQGVNGRTFVAAHSATCIRFATAAPAKLGTQTMTFNRAADRNALAKTFQVTAQGKANSILGGSGSAKASHARSITIDSSEVVIGAFATYETFKTAVAPQKGGRIALTAEAERLYKGKDGLQKFREACGDYYVSEIYHGGSFEGVLKASESNRVERERIAASFSFSGAYGSASARGKQSLRKEDHKDRFNITLRAYGVNAKPLPVTTEKFVAYFSEFPTAVLKDKRPTRMTIVSYRSLLPRGGPTIQGTLDQLTDLYLQREDLKYLLLDMTRNRAKYRYYSSINDYRVNSLYRQVQAELALLKGAISACTMSRHPCVRPAAVSPHDYYLRAQLPLPRAESSADVVAAELDAYIKKVRHKRDTMEITRHNGRAWYRKYSRAISDAAACRTWVVTSRHYLYNRDQLRFWVDDTLAARDQTPEEAHIWSPATTAELLDLRFRRLGTVERPSWKDAPTVCAERSPSAKVAMDAAA